MTSTLTELETEIWQYIHSALYGKPLIEGTQIPDYQDRVAKIATSYMIVNHPEFTEDAITNIVKAVYIKDFKTD